MIRFQHVQCCGVRDLGGLGQFRTSVEAFLDMGRWLFGDTSQYAPSRNQFRYAIFSQAREESTYGHRFAAYIREHQLGELVETGFNVNPNSGNALKLWTWAINWVTFRAHYDALMAAGARAVTPNDLMEREIFPGQCV